MPFEIGNRAASKERLLRQAYLNVFDRHPQGRMGALYEIVIPMIAEAKSGNVNAFKEIRDTIDGKPQVSIDVSSADGATPLASLVIAAMLGLRNSEQPLTIIQGAEEKSSDPHPPSNTAEGGAELVYALPDNFVQISTVLVPTNLDENSV